MDSKDYSIQAITRVCINKLIFWRSWSKVDIDWNRIVLMRKILIKLSYEYILRLYYLTIHALRVILVYYIEFIFRAEDRFIKRSLVLRGGFFSCVAVIYIYTWLMV